MCLETPLTLIFQVGVYCFRAIRCAPDRQHTHLLLTNGDALLASVFRVRNLRIVGVVEDGRVMPDGYRKGLNNTTSGFWL